MDLSTYKTKRRYMLAIVIISAIVLFGLGLLSSVYIFARSCRTIDDINDVRGENALDTTLAVMKEIETLSRLTIETIVQNDDVRTSFSEGNFVDAERQIVDLIDTPRLSECFIILVDETGSILSRNENYEVGEVIIAKHGLSLALQGQTFSHIVQCKDLPVALNTVAPIKDFEGTIRGALVIGYSLVESNFVHYLKELTGNEYFIFLGDDLIRTTLMLDDSEISQLKLDSAILDKMNHREKFYGETTFLDDPYEIAARPLVDIDSRVIGTIVAGIPLTTIYENKNQSILLFGEMYALLFGLLIILLVLYLRESKVLLKDQNSVLEQEVEKQTKNIHKMQEASIMAMAYLAETRDEETGTHIHRTKLYVQVLASHLSKMEKYKSFLTQSMIDLIVQSAPLHDIGKIGIPDTILRKPGRFTEEEKELMKQHVAIGGDAIMHAKKAFGIAESFLSVAYEIVYYHHEKWDGSGYLSGLLGEEIPLSARIMAIADAYDALTSERVYKKAFSHEEAMKIIVDSSGTHFDPSIIKALLDVQEEFKAILLARDIELIELDEEKV
ncbi:MAG: HD domain-containing phosphohydrolase [Sphaerochaetaceae bacterium]